MSITCTFPDGKSHTIDHADHTVIAIRRILATLTPYEPAAIQLYSTEGEGRELTVDDEIVPPGSELQAMGHDLQFERKTQLRTALTEYDGAGCWCKIAVCEDRAQEFEDSTKGNLLRLVQTNGDFFAFVSEGVHHQTLRPSFYLLHKDQFCVKWVRDGENNAGNMLHGDELEANWNAFSHHANEDDDDGDMEVPDIAAFCEACDGHYPPGRGHVFWYRNAIERNGRRFYSACRACIELHDIDEPALYTN